MEGDRDRRFPRPNSRQTVFCPPAAPHKGALTINEMLKIAHSLGRGDSARKAAREQQRSPTTVCKIRQRIMSSDDSVPQGLSDQNLTRQILHHFVAFCLLSNPLSTGESITRQARDLGMSTSASTVNRIARKMSFECHFTQRAEKLTERHRRYRVEFAATIPIWIGYYLNWCAK